MPHIAFSRQQGLITRIATFRGLEYGCILCKTRNLACKYFSFQKDIHKLLKSSIYSFLFRFSVAIICKGGKFSLSLPMGLGLKTALKPHKYKEYGKSN
jgi:hypothetical protein